MANKVRDEEDREHQSHDFDKVAHVNFLRNENEVLICFLALLGVVQGTFLPSLDVEVDERLEEFDAHIEFQVVDAYCLD